MHQPHTLHGRFVPSAGPVAAGKEVLMAAAPPKSLAAQIMVASQGAAPKVAEVINYLKPIAKPVRCHVRVAAIHDSSSMAAR